MMNPQKKPKMKLDYLVEYSMKTLLDTTNRGQKMWTQQNSNK